VPIILSQMAFALGACGGLARILMPSAWNTTSKEPVSVTFVGGDALGDALVRVGCQKSAWPVSCGDD
jgi:hypothetical protein